MKGWRANGQKLRDQLAAQYKAAAPSLETVMQDWLKAIEQPIDTSTAAGKCFLDMLGVFAEFETNLRRERQLEGIADAKARGIYKGRKRSIDPAKVKQMCADGLGPSAVAKAPAWQTAKAARALAIVDRLDRPKTQPPK